MLLCIMVLVNRPKEYEVKLIFLFFYNIFYLIIPYISFFLFDITVKELAHVYFIAILEPIIKHATFGTTNRQVFVCEVVFILKKLFLMIFVYHFDYLLLESIQRLNWLFSLSIRIKLLNMINIPLTSNIIEFFTIHMLQYPLIIAAHTKLFEICSRYSWVLGRLRALFYLNSF